MQISIIGGGYVGLVTATCLAEIGHRVTIIEIDNQKSESIKQGISPIFEEKLDDLLKKNIGINLFVSTTYESVQSSDASFICVGTPPAVDGSADLSFIKCAARSISEQLTIVPHRHVVIVKSTVPPGTTDCAVRPFIAELMEKTRDLALAMNPEFLREGRAIHDFMNPDRVVIGSEEEWAGDLVQKVYEPLSAKVLRCSIIEAEMIKYVSNAFLATKISFSNEIGNICKRLGINVYHVMEGVGLDSRINPLFLNAGAGFGGSCFPKDVSALIKLAESVGEYPILLNSVMEINNLQPKKLISLLEKKIHPLSGKKIAILGLAFKDNTDDIRDSRSISVISELLEKGAKVVAYDPIANEPMRRIFPTITYCMKPEDALSGADACLIMTEWPEFSKLDAEFNLMKSKIIIEGRKILTIKDIEGICW